jgi:regulator of protease activity HflC (stomatin/prohibitin superfamily)
MIVRPRDVFDNRPNIRRFGMNRAIIGAAIAGLAIIAIIFGSWYTVDQAERGVLLRIRHWSRSVEGGAVQMPSKRKRIKDPVRIASIMMPWRVVNPDFTASSVLVLAARF